jgi:hypothetical protein
MQRPTLRYIVAAVLIAAAGIGGFFVFEGHRRAAAIETARREATSRIERMITTSADVGSAQQAYVAPGQPEQPWLERSAMLLQQFGEDAAAIRPLLHATNSGSALDEVNKHFKAIVVVDGRAREYLQEAQQLLAADLIFSEGHDAVAMLGTTLRTLATSEQQAADAMRASIDQQEWAILGSLAVVWIAGLLMLAPMRRTWMQDSRLEGVRDTLGLHSPVPAPASPIDLNAAADVCSALARASDTPSLREALACAAAVLDARGIVVWMGAGEELFPAVAHGYDERVIARLGPISRKAANATAEAWRSAQMRTVPADAASNGAIAAPLSGASGCIGVFAAEVRRGREKDSATRAVAAMIAAQLAAIVSAWPAPSTSKPIAAARG